MSSSEPHNFKSVVQQKLYFYYFQRLKPISVYEKSNPGCFSNNHFCGHLFAFAEQARFTAPSPQIESILRIGTLNLNYQNTNAEKISRLLLETNFDLLVVLEWQGKNLDLNILKSARYTVFLNEPRMGTHGVCIVGKNRLNLKASLIPSPVQGSCAIPVATARFTINDRHVSILGIHAPPPVPKCKKTTIATLQKICFWIDQGVLKRNIGVAVAEDAVIIAGDLNMHPFHPVMACFEKSGLQDVFREGFLRLMPTWTPGFLVPAMVRIDYIFSSSVFDVSASYSFSAPGSDHRGIMADLKIKD